MTPPSPQRLDARISVDADGVVAFTRELVRLRTVNDPAGGASEAPAAALVAAKMREFGWDPVITEPGARPAQRGGHRGRRRARGNAAFRRSHRRGHRGLAGRVDGRPVRRNHPGRATLWPWCRGHEIRPGRDGLRRTGIAAGRRISGVYQGLRARRRRRNDDRRAPPGGQRRGVRCGRCDCLRAGGRRDLPGVQGRRPVHRHLRRRDGPRRDATARPQPDPGDRRFPSGAGSFCRPT